MNPQHLAKLPVKNPDPGNVVSDEVDDIVTHAEDEGYDERKAVMITERDERGHLMKMISGGA